MTTFLPKGYLEEAMRDKMKNIRNVKPRIKRPPNAESPPQATKQQKIQYLPRRPIQLKIPPSEDIASCQKHVKMLQLESQKPSPDKRTIKNLMDLTYPLRRQEICKGMEISAILKVYPPLKKIDQVAIQ